MLTYIARDMVAAFAQPGRLDRIAMSLSGLCLVHCVSTAVLVVFLSSAGDFLGAPIVHEAGLIVAMVLGAIALGRGVAEHGFMLPSSVGALGLGVMAGALQLPHGPVEAAYTMAGVSVLALGHRLNCIAAD